MKRTRTVRTFLLAVTLAGAAVAVPSGAIADPPRKAAPAATAAPRTSPSPSAAPAPDGLEHGGVRRGTREQKRFALIILASALGVYLAYRLIRR